MPLTRQDLKSLHLKPEETIKVNTLDQLLSQPPLMVTTKAIKTFNIDLFTEQRKIKKGTILFLSISFFNDLHINKKTKQKMLVPHNIPFIKLFKRYRGQDLNNKRLLIWRGGGFGDIAWVIPICKKLKELYPTCHITMASHPRFLKITKYFPKGLLDKTLGLPLTTQHLYSNDYHLTFEGSIERCVEAEYMNAHDIFAKIAGLDIDHTDPKYSLELIPNKALIEDNLLPKSPFIVFQCRASSEIRSLSPNKTAEIAKRVNELGYSIIYLDRPDYDVYYYELIKQKKLDPSMNINLCKQCKDIGTTITIISKSEGVIGVDSAFNHIAESTSKKVLGIFGPFSGDLRLRYYKQADWIQPISKETTGCSRFPCFAHQTEKHLCKSFKRGYPPRCIESIPTDDIITKFKKLFIGEKHE